MSMQSPRRPRAIKAQRHREKPLPKPLDAAQLDALALAYVARFATSGGKLAAYLARKLRERGWQEDAPPPDLAALVERMAAQGYIDDAGFALAKGQGLLRRGYGARRIEGALMQAGIAAEIREAVRGDESSGGAPRWNLHGASGSGLMPRRAALTVLPAITAQADDGGISFWLPGQYFSHRLPVDPYRLQAAKGAPGLQSRAAVVDHVLDGDCGVSGLSCWRLNCPGG